MELMVWQVTGHKSIGELARALLSFKWPTHPHLLRQYRLFTIFT